MRPGPLPLRGACTCLLLLALCPMTLHTGTAAQRGASLPDALRMMVETERAFAAHALEVGWKDAFLEYFAGAAVGFDRGQLGLAHDQIRLAREPPADLQLRWEPRYGDVAASGELGYLTGPLQTSQASRNNGRPRHSTYLSIWKRQTDGAFKVVLNVGTPTSGPARFPAEFTRAAHAGRFTGDYDDRTPPLQVADGVMNSALRSGAQARAYRGRLAEGARLHRPNVMPVVGEASILRWLESQPRFSASDTRYAEAARSGDLGYTVGTYAIGGRSGSYVRVWVRERSGQWQIAMDVIS